MRVPHPFPYQGSKRNLAKAILDFFPSNVCTLFEPFAGSAAITIASACEGLAQKYVINDLNKPLIDLWERIIRVPETISSEYEKLWSEQNGWEREFYNDVRDSFNATKRPDYLLYLLARCVKASVRYNANGDFNQSPDNRRKGMHPATMSAHIKSVSRLLRGRVECKSTDYKPVLLRATKSDLVYLDPPYQGVCSNRDARYLGQVGYEDFANALFDLNRREISFIVSYDGRTGNKTFGPDLPISLRLHREELHAGPSSQATLLGRDDLTYESLYLSTALLKRLDNSRPRSLINAVDSIQINSFS